MTVLKQSSFPSGKLILVNIKIINIKTDSQSFFKKCFDKSKICCKLYFLNDIKRIYIYIYIKYKKKKIKGKRKNVELYIKSPIDYKQA